MNKPEQVTWLLCVHIGPWETNHRVLHREWHPKGKIPEHWFPVKDWVKKLPEGESPDDPVFAGVFSGV